MSWWNCKSGSRRGTGNTHMTVANKLVGTNRCRSSRVSIKDGLDVGFSIFTDADACFQHPRMWMFS